MYPTNLEIHNALGNLTATLAYLKGEFERARHLDADERAWRIAAVDRALDDLAVLKAATGRPAPPKPASWADAMIQAAIHSPAGIGVEENHGKPTPSY